MSHVETIATDSASLLAMVKAAIATAPDVHPWNDDERRGAYCAGPDRAPEHCAELAGPVRPKSDYRGGSGVMATRDCDGMRVASQTPDNTLRVTAEAWYGPLMPKTAERVTFAHAIGASQSEDGEPRIRGRYTVRALRRNLEDFAASVKRAALAFDGKVKRPPKFAPKRGGSAPHVVAREMLREGKPGEALTVTQSAGAVFFGQSSEKAQPGKPAPLPILYMVAETCTAGGHDFTIARRVDTGRFAFVHTACALSAHGPDARDGFGSSAAAIDNLTMHAECDAWRAKVNGAVANAGPFDQSDALALWQDRRAADEASDDAPADDAEESSAADPAEASEAAADPIERAPADSAAFLAECEETAARIAERVTYCTEAAAIDRRVRAKIEAAERDAAEAAAELKAAPSSTRRRQSAAARLCADAIRRDAEAAQSLAADPDDDETAADGVKTAPDERTAAPTPETMGEAAAPILTDPGALAAAASGIAKSATYPGAALAAACLARFGVADPDACRHLPAFAGLEAAARAGDLSADAAMAGLAARLAEAAAAPTAANDPPTDPDPAPCAPGGAVRELATDPGIGAAADALARIFGAAGAALPAELRAAIERGRAGDAMARAPIRAALIDAAASMDAAEASAAADALEAWHTTAAPLPTQSQTGPLPTQSQADEPAGGAEKSGPPATQSRAAGSPRSFAEMTSAQLREFIDGCHRGKDYGSDFEEASRELNYRRDGGPAPDGTAPTHPLPATSGPVVEYAQGQQDARDGFARDACPFQFDPSRACWLRGFDSIAPAAPAIPDAAEVSRLVSVYLAFAAERREPDESAADAIARQTADAKTRAENLRDVQPQRAADYFAAGDALHAAAIVAARESGSARDCAAAGAARVAHRPLSHWLQAESDALRDCANGIGDAPGEANPTRAAVWRLVSAELADAAGAQRAAEAADAEALAAFENGPAEHELNAMLAQSLADCAHLPEFGGSVAFAKQTAHGETWRALAGPDVTGADPYRVTWFTNGRCYGDAAADPSGHSGYATLAEACAEALARGYLPTDAAEAFPPATQSQGGPVPTQSRPPLAPISDPIIAKAAADVRDAREAAEAIRTCRKRDAERWHAERENNRAFDASMVDTSPAEFAAMNPHLSARAARDVHAACLARHRRTEAAAARLAGMRERAEARRAAAAELAAGERERARRETRAREHAKAAAGRLRIGGDPKKGATRYPLAIFADGVRLDDVNISAIEHTGEAVTYTASADNGRCAHASTAPELAAAILRGTRELARKAKHATATAEAARAAAGDLLPLATHSAPVSPAPPPATQSRKHSRRALTRDLEKSSSAAGGGFYVMVDEKSADHEPTLARARVTGKRLADAETIPAVWWIADEHGEHVEDITRGDGADLAAQVARFNAAHPLATHSQA